MSKYIDKDRVFEYIVFGVVGKDITCGELKRGIETLPTIEVSEDVISRQAAIEALGEEPDIAQDTDEEWAEHDSWVTHRNAIASLPPVEPKPVCEDAISREIVMDVISNCEHICDVYGELKKLIENIPSVEPTNKAICEHFYKGYCDRFEDGCFWQCQKDPKRPKGRWINECENGHGFWIGTCDQCGKENHVGNFCPNCGADMKGADDED